MKISFYNTLNHQLEPFEPITPGRVTMYNCGPTVYDFAHIGNFRSFTFADVVRRFLELAGNDVHQVMNLTDVGHMTDDQLADGGGEDKMAVAAKRLKEAKKSGKADVDNPDDPYQVAQYFIEAFIADAKLLQLKIADEYPQQMPRATEHIAAMQNMIARLIKNDHAYVADDGAVYYNVQSYEPYGQLSGNTLDKLRGGAGGRVLDEHQQGKRHPSDFLLWKPDSSHIMKWDSPWGTGYPGWHIECSAMATELLKAEEIDIHTGGEDNIFPHHECEIAQTCGASGKAHFARVWMHARLMMVEGEKMSKSKGNFFTVRDVLGGKATGSKVDPCVLRYELLKAHYRSNMNFTIKGLHDSAGAVAKLRAAAGEAGAAKADVDLSHPVLSEFAECLADDLNMAGAMAAVFKWLNDGGDKDDAATAGVLEKINSVVGFASSSDAAASGDDASDADALAKQLDEARAAKDYAKADELRKAIQDAGYEVMTTKDGTKVQRKLA